MQDYSNILIFHPAAIGDAVLATPVAFTLKQNFPGAKITYWSHASLRPLLLSLCPHIDEFIDFNKELGFLEQRKILLGLKPDLFIDLSNSTRGLLMPLFGKMDVLRYQKNANDGPDQQHAVGNFLETIKSICPITPPKLFPTIFPDAIAEELIPQLMPPGKGGLRPLIGIVPGVGQLRPHRAWRFDGWVYLIRHILELDTHAVAMIGGADDFDLAQRINSELDGQCLNFCGQLKLDETAAVLKCCDVVLSGDTGPAHIAVAVGTPVIGLYGPTFPARSGPYGYFDYILDQSASCQCRFEKHCKLAGPTDSGECMGRIMLPEVIEKLQRLTDQIMTQSAYVEPSGHKPDDQLPTLKVVD